MGAEIVKHDVQASILTVSAIPMGDSMIIINLTVTEDEKYQTRLF